MPEPARIPLIQSPTPLHRLDRLSADLGLDLWIKRDDLTGFGGGGNKGRKLEYLMAEAVAQRAEVVVTCGSVQSNFVRQLGAACSVLGMKCAAAVMELPFEDVRPKESAIGSEGGNVMLDEMLDIDMREFPDGHWETLYEHAESVAKEFEKAGKRVYRIPVGGSSPLGAFSFYKAGLEAMAQAPEAFDWLVFASSSGSTQVGLTYAYHSSSTKVLGIVSDPEPEIVNDFADIGKGLADLIGVPALAPKDFTIDISYVGDGYGAKSEAADEAISVMARREGIFLDPVYSGKAFAGLLDYAKKGKLGGRVLFWHTGGFPSLFAWKR